MEELETPRLKLRQLEIHDAAQLALLRSDEQINRYLNRPASTSHDAALEFVDKILASNAYYWAITLKNETELIGTVCLYNADYEKSDIEIGYELLTQFQGRGLMMEAVRAVIAFNKTVLQFATMIAITHIENTSSIKLLEKNNFTRDPSSENPAHENCDSSNEVRYSLNQN